MAAPFFDFTYKKHLTIREGLVGATRMSVRPYTGAPLMARQCHVQQIGRKFRRTEALGRGGAC